MPVVYIIEDDVIMSECLELAVQASLQTVRVETFSNAIAAMERISDQLPDLILLDVILDGPDGFTFLNELVSYHDTAQIPIIIISSLHLAPSDLEHYGVVKVLDKATMTPASIAAAVGEGMRHVERS